MAVNPFQSGTRKVIPAVLIYAKKDGQVLMIQKKDHWNGLGGKCELNESYRETARREFGEEAGVDLPEERFQPLGVLQFPNFKPERNEDWLVFVLCVDYSVQDPEPLSRTDEGSLHWIEGKDLKNLPLWEGDERFLAFVLERKPFVGTFWYLNGRLTKYLLESLG